jgi:hypothetical protein
MHRLKTKRRHYELVYLSEPVGLQKRTYIFIIRKPDITDTVLRNVIMSSQILSTASALFPQRNLLSNSSSAPSFDSSNLILIRNGAPPAPDKIKSQIKALVVAAEEAATSLTCSSILAGHGSESDDNGDAGLWLGQGAYGKGHENEILEALDLSGWAQGGEVRLLLIH